MKVKAICLLLLTIICPQLFAYDTSHEGVARLIFERAPTAITRVEKDKIYIDGARISLLRNRIALRDDLNMLIPLSTIRSGEYGLYVKANGFDIFGVWQCHVQGCWYWNSNSVNVCQNCHTPRGGFPE